MSAIADPALLKSLHRQMLRIRLIEERIAAVYPEQEMRCPVHLSIGQEATAVGVSAHLTPHDWVMSGHRSHAHYLAKGGDLKGMLAEMYGRVTGCTRGKGGSMHLIDLAAGFLGAVPIVGSTVEVDGISLRAERLEGRRNRVSHIIAAPVAKGAVPEQTDLEDLLDEAETTQQGVPREQAE